MARRKQTKASYAKKKKNYKQKKKIKGKKNGENTTKKCFTINIGKNTGSITERDNLQMDFFFLQFFTSVATFNVIKFA